MAQAQNIAVVCPRFAEGGAVGGAETLLRALAERLAAAGRTVTFLTTCAQDHFTWKNVLPAGERRVGPLTVIFFPVDEDRNVEQFLEIQSRISRRIAVTPEEEQAWARNSVNSRALIDHLRTRGADYDQILMGPYLFGLILFASEVHPEKTLLVPCLHDEPFAYLGPTRSLFARVAGCLFNSEPERDLAQRLFSLANREHPVVGFGFDPFETRPGAFAARHNLTRPYVIYCGRREGGKGIPLMLDYVQTFLERTGRDLDVVFTGSGPIDAPEALRKRIHDLGFVSEQDKHDAMAGAVAFIHPSLLESLGIALLESFLAQTPALVRTHCPVLQWQCQRSGAGLWFGNYPEFEEELLLLLDQEPVRKQMGARGRDFVKREYAWSAVDRRLLEAVDA